MKSLEFRAMNTSVLLFSESKNDPASGLAQARAFIEDCERRLSRFRPDSELSQLNSREGEWMHVADDLFDLLVLSKAYHRETGGLFDPSILPDLRYAGYDVSMDQLRLQGAAGEAAEPRRPRRDFAAMELDPSGRRVRLPVGMQIDLGGIAKGWIVQQAAMLLKANGGAGAVNAGGDMFFAGTPADGTRWRVEIEDPREESRTAAVLEVAEGAVVTSSVRKRSWTQGGESRDRKSVV